jgi:hypothetical protein
MATTRVITGKVRAKPEMARAPTPWPINTLSIILYKEFTSIPTIAGNANFHNNALTGSLPNANESEYATTTMKYFLLIN